MVRFVVALGHRARDGSESSTRSEKVERTPVEKSPGGRNGRAEIVRALPPAEQLYQKHLITIGERRRDLSNLERDLVALRDAVTGFEALAQARLGEMFAELRRLGGSPGDVRLPVLRLPAAPHTEG